MTRILKLKQMNLKFFRVIILLLPYALFGQNIYVQKSKFKLVDEKVLNICEKIFFEELKNPLVLNYYLEASGIECRYEKSSNIKVKRYPFRKIVNPINYYCTDGKALITLEFSGSLFTATFLIDTNQKLGYIIRSGINSEQRLRRNYVKLIRKFKLQNLMNLDIIMTFLIPEYFNIRVVRFRNKTCYISANLNDEKMLLLVYEGFRKVKIMDFDVGKWKNYLETNIHDHAKIGKEAFFKSLPRSR